LPKLNEFPENLRCSNINSAMHKLLVGVNVWRERKASVNKNALVCIYWNIRTLASINTCNGSF